MKVIKTKNALKKFVKGKTIGLVPTMGSFHEGHVSLIKKSLRDNPYTLVSIFVNPKQFGPNEDYARYPRDFSKDKKILSSLKVDAVFSPDVDEVYKSKEGIYLGCQKLENLYCGQYRPGFFNGVMLVVLKLFNLVEPKRAYFGKKDYQQYFLIKKMVSDLDLKTKVIGLPTVRNVSGLALSSRNQYLSKTEMVTAEHIYKVLKQAKVWTLKKEVVSCFSLKKKIIERFKKEKGFQLQYIDIVNKDDLLPARKLQGVVILMAGFINQVRLIDNIEI